MGSTLNINDLLFEHSISILKKMDRILRLSDTSLVEKQRTELSELLNEIAHDILMMKKALKL